MPTYSNAESKVHKALSDIHTIAGAIELYQHDKSRTPRVLEELLDGYLNESSKFLDPWGNEYNYSLTAPLEGLPEMDYYLWSLGKDNQWGGKSENKDWVNWK